MSKAITHSFIKLYVFIFDATLSQIFYTNVLPKAVIKNDLITSYSYKSIKLPGIALQKI